MDDVITTNLLALNTPNANGISYSKDAIMFGIEKLNNGTVLGKLGFNNDTSFAKTFNEATHICSNVRIEDDMVKCDIRKLPGVLETLYDSGLVEFAMSGSGIVQDNVVKHFEIHSINVVNKI